MQEQTEGRVRPLLATSPVLAPDGTPTFVAGGDDAWKTLTYKGYCVSFEWRKIGRNIRKCLVIWPESRFEVAGVRHGQWVITINGMFHMVGFNRDGKCTGSASAHLLREAREVLASQMGKDLNDKQAHSALVDTVLHFADDLVKMPVVPRKMRQRLRPPPMWDVAVQDKSSGRTITEREV